MLFPYYVHLLFQVTTDEHGQLIVARILAGSAAAKQALLSIGDVLLEVDGIPIDSEDQLKEAVSKPNDRVTLKVGPNLKDKSSQLVNKLNVSKDASFFFQVYFKYLIFFGVVYLIIV